MAYADKALVTFSGKPLISHVITRLAPQVGGLAVSARGDPARFAGFGFPVIADIVDRGLGPLEGVLAGMIWAAGGGVGHVLCVPVDGPFLPLTLAEELGRGAVPRLAMAGGRQHPAFGMWPVGLAPELQRFLTSGAVPRLRDFAALVRAEWVDFEGADAFENLNSRDDIARAEARG